MMKPATIKLYVPQVDDIAKELIEVFVNCFVRQIFRKNEMLNKFPA